MNAAIESKEDAASAPSRLSYVTALIASGLSALILWHRFPSIYQDGAMWAEGGTLYFLKAQQGTFLENIKALDYGYVPLWGRLWAFFVSQLGVSASGAAQAYNCIALIVAALCCGSFGLPQFRYFIPSDLCRIFVCLGLACASNYETKTFINVSYYPSIICYLVLALVATYQEFSTKSGILTGVFIAVSMLSKPHYVTFAPFLIILLLVALLERRLQLFALAFFPFAAACLQLSVIHSHRSGVSARAIPPAELATIWARWVGASATAELFGRPVMQWSSLSIITICAIITACIFTLKIHPLKIQHLLWPAILGCSLLFSGIALCVLSFPDMYIPLDPHYVQSRLEFRHFFIPMVGCYFTLAVLIAQILPHRGQLFFIALWLSMAWPFGWVRAPAAPSWPTVGFSAWSPLAREIFDNKPAGLIRGCIPINPYPWVLGLNCQLLQGIDAVSGLLQQPAVALKARYRTPGEANEWLVDIIGLRLFNINDQTQRIIAYDSQGVEMAHAKALASPGSALTYFHFAPPLRAPAEIAIIDSAQQPSSLVMDTNQFHPEWVWLGSKIN